MTNLTRWAGLAAVVPLSLGAGLGPADPGGPGASATIVQELRIDHAPGADLKAIADGVASVRRDEAKGRIYAQLKPKDDVAASVRALQSIAGVTSVKAYRPRLIIASELAQSRTALEASRTQYQAALAAFAALPVENRVTAGPVRADRGRLGQAEEYAEWYEARTYPKGRLDWSAHRDAQRAKLRLAAPPLAVNWQYIGPTNLQGYEQTGFGPSPVNGRINGVSFDPFDGQRAYAASARGGVWVTPDGGSSWDPLSDFWSEIATSVVVVNPSFQNHLYVGTGDHPQNYGSGMGVMVSKDGGANWVQRGAQEFGGRLISDIVVDPIVPTILVVGSGGGPGDKNSLYRSLNEGQTWSVVIAENTHWTDLDVSIRVGNQQYIYAAGHKSETERVLWRSGDRGQTWASVVLPAGSEKDRIYIACSKLQVDRIYIYYTGSGRVFRGDGPAPAWVEITDNLPDVSDGKWGQGHYNNGLTCLRREEAVGDVEALIVQNIDVYLSGDSSGDWESIGLGYTGGDLLHVDHHFVAAHPNAPNLFLFGNDGGVYTYLYDSLGNTGTFTPLSEHLGTALVNRISVDPTVLDGVIAGTQDNGFAWCAADAANWGNLLSGDAGHSAINQTIPGFQYLIPPNLGKSDDGDGYIWETSDGWATRAKRKENFAGDKMRNSPPISIDPSLPRYVYVATNYLYRYDAVTQTWSARMGGQKLSTRGHVRHLAVAPSSSARIYTVSGDGEVWMTTDGGTQWTRIDTGNPGLPVASIGHVSVDPNNANRVLVALETADAETPNLWECANVTAPARVWTPKEGIVANQKLPRSPVNAIARKPSSPSLNWYVATEVGVFATADAGKTWVDMTPVPSFPNVPVRDLKVQAATNTLYAATYGRGVWRTPLPTGSGEIVP